MRITELCVNRPIATLMFFIGSVIIGAIAIYYLQIDLLPNIEPPVIQVLTTWSGATAEDVEAQVTKYIEETLISVSDLEEISSRSKDNISIVTCKFAWGTNLDVATNNVRDRLEWITRFLPNDAEKPLIFKFSSSEYPIIMATVTAKENWYRIYQLVDKEIVEQLRRIPGVGSAYPEGGPIRQISIWIDPEKLKSYALPFSTIEKYIQLNNVDIPSGYINIHTKEIPITLPGRIKNVEQLKNLLIPTQNGNFIRLKDVATIEDTFKKQRRFIYDETGRALLLYVQKQSGANTVEVAKKVKKKLAEIQKNLPADVRINISFDTSKFITNTIRNLTKSLIIGGILVIIVTALFLRSFWSSLIIATAIPYSILMTFLCMYFIGYTINTLSLSSLIISIGMVVDNSIVTLEMIKRLKDEGRDYTTSAKMSSKIIGLAITASTFTTIIVFLPLIFTGGITGIFFKQLAVTISISLIMSLLSSITLVPMLASRLLAKEKTHGKLFIWGERVLINSEEYYSKIITKVLQRPKQIIAICLIIFFASLSLIPFIGSEFVPKEDTGEARVFIRLPVDSNIETTLKAAKRIFDFAIKNIPEKEHVYIFAGQSEQGYSEAMGFEEGSYAGGVGLKLVPKDKRKKSAQEIADLLRTELEKIPELDWGFSSATSFIEQSLMGTGGKQFVVDITGSNLKDIRNAAFQIEEKLKKLPAFIDVSSSIMSLRTEFNFILNENKAPMLGLNAAIVGDTLRTYIDGKRIAYFRQDNEDIPIVMKIKDAENLTLNQIKTLSIPTITGNYQNILNVTTIDQNSKELKIEHKNRMRLYQVSANLRKISLGDAAKLFTKEMDNINLPAGVHWKISGEYEEQVKAFQALFALLLLGMIFVYMTMAAQFESLRHPFYIMFSVPFSISGVLFLLSVTGFTINLTSFIGMVMLIGIVVNNSIVYVTYVNQQRSMGKTLYESLIISGKHRLRPILMTWLTTFFGILPLALTRGEGSESYNPLGVAVIGGLLTSTIISLILIPSVYYVFEKKKEQSAN